MGTSITHGPFLEKRAAASCEVRPPATPPAAGGKSSGTCSSKLLDAPAQQNRECR